LVSPTGSGKTLIVAVLAHEAINSNLFKSVAVATPFIHVESSFATLPTRVIAGTYTADLTDFWTVPREHNLEPSILEFQWHTQHARPPQPCLLTTHAALTCWGPTVLPDDLTGRLLVIDEAHHVFVTPKFTTAIGKFVEAWRSKGGAVLYVTATDFRGNGEPTLPDGCPTYRRTLTTHSDEKYAPAEFKAHTVILNYEATSFHHLSGDTLPDIEAMEGDSYVAIAERWVADGRPKAIVRVPEGQGNRAKRWATGLAKILRAAGARVLDVVGSGKGTQKRLLDELTKERAVRDWSDSAWDVIIACKRFDEATDWPLCSHVYCVGLTRSLQRVIQLWGRATRWKGLISNYPEEFADTATITFFVPKISAERLNTFEDQYHEYIWLVACYIENHEIGREVRSAYRKRMFGVWPPGITGTQVIQALEDNESVNATAALAVVKAAQATGEGATVGAIVDQLGDPSLPETLLLLDNLGAAVEEEVKTAIETVVGEESPLNIRGRLREAFLEIIREYRDRTYSQRGDPVRVISGFTGEDAVDVIGRLTRKRRTMGPNLSEDEILAAATAFIKVIGRAPHSKDGDASKYFKRPESWVKVDEALRRGLRGLKGGRTLLMFLVEHGLRARPQKFGGENRGRVNRHTVITGMKAFMFDHGTIPKTNMDEPMHYLGFETTWRTLNLAMAQGRIEGVPEGYGLKKLAAEEGLLHPPKMPTETEITAALQAHLNRAGCLPHLGDSTFPDLPRGYLDTWSKVFSRWGRKRLGRGETSGEFLVRHGFQTPKEPRPVVHLPPPTEITESAMLGHLLKVKKAVDRYTQISGWRPGVVFTLDGVDMTCQRIDTLLRNGGNGLPGGDSLEAFALRHHLNRTEESIALAMDRSRVRTGLWPSSLSEDASKDFGWPESWSLVDCWLRNRGSSVRKFRESRFGIGQLSKNSAAISESPLDDAKILAAADAYADDHGGLPTDKSGDASKYFGFQITWAQVQSAIRLGYRGLPGGDTFSRFLARHRLDRLSYTRGRLINRRPLSETSLLAAVDAFQSEHGRCPRQKDGDASKFFGQQETWAGVIAAHGLGGRGLRGLQKESWGDFLRRHGRQV
jgi:hypothetical protein